MKGLSPGWRDSGRLHDLLSKSFITWFLLFTNSQVDNLKKKKEIKV